MFVLQIRACMSKRLEGVPEPEEPGSIGDSLFSPPYTPTFLPLRPPVPPRPLQIPLRTNVRRTPSDRPVHTQEEDLFIQLCAAVSLSKHHAPPVSKQDI